MEKSEQAPMETPSASISVGDFSLSQFPELFPSPARDATSVRETNVQLIGTTETDRITPLSTLTI